MNCDSPISHTEMACNSKYAKYRQNIAANKFMFIFKLNASISTTKNRAP